MPYKTNDELPDGIKNSLPSDAQTVWRNVFNGVVGKGGSEDSARKQAWTAVKNGWEQNDQGDWVKKMSKTYEFWTEIFSSGTWNGDKYSDDDLSSIVANYEALKETFKVPIKLGHTWKQGQPALGWVTEIKKHGSKLIAKLSQVPEIVYNAIKEGRYKNVSVELYYNFKHSNFKDKVFDKVLKAVALLGADTPAVDNLAGLEAYMIQQMQDASFDKIASYEFENEFIETDNTFKFKLYNNKNEHKENKLMGEDLKFFQKKISDLESKLKTMETDIKAKEDALKNKDKEYSEFQAKIRKEQKESRVNDLKSFCESMVKAKSMLPGQRDKLFKMVEDGKLVYDEEKGFGLPISFIQEFVSEFKTTYKKEFGRITDNDIDLEDKDKIESKVDELTKKYASEHKVDYSDALIAILDDPNNSKLADAYKFMHDA